MVRRLMVLCVVAGAVIAPGMAQGQLLFTFSPPVEAGSPGQTVTYSGSLTNPTVGDTFFLNGLSITFAGSGFTFDTNPFFANFPFSLGPQETATGALFSVDIAPSAPQGHFTGFAA